MVVLVDAQFKSGKTSSNLIEIRAQLLPVIKEMTRWRFCAKIIQLDLRKISIAVPSLEWPHKQTWKLWNSTQDCLKTQIIRISSGNSTAFSSIPFKIRSRSCHCCTSSLYEAKNGVKLFMAIIKDKLSVREKREEICNHILKSQLRFQFLPRFTWSCIHFIFRDDSIHRTPENSDNKWRFHTIQGMSDIEPCQDLELSFHFEAWVYYGKVFEVNSQSKTKPNIMFW